MFDRVLAVAAEISELVEPRLAHRDLYLDNLLVGDDGRISAIIDLDLAEAWDPVVDFVKPRSQVFPLIPGAEESFEAGYAETAGGLPAAFEQRVRVVEVLELSNHVVNCVAGGMTEYAAHNRRRLEAVLAAAW
jgi:aminoglycoside phosphotransferase (APT) family kinase protein